MKKNKQLNLYFDENFYQKKQNKIFDNRINIIILVFLFLSFLTFSKLILIGFEKKEFYFANEYKEESLKRRSIVDRNYNLLAYNVKTHNLIIRTKKVKNFDNLNLKLRIEFPDIDLEKIKKFNTRSFHVLKKNLSPSEYNKALNLGEPSIELVRNEIRVYPNKNLFSHIIGNVDTDQQGVSGLELFLNNKILNKEKIKDPIILSLDQNIQFMVRETLKEGIKIFNFSKKAW